MVEGRERARAVRVEEQDGFFIATLRRAPVVAESNRRTAGLVARIGTLVEQYLKLSQEQNPEGSGCAARCRAGPDDNLLIMKLDRGQAGPVEIIRRTRLLRLIELLEIELDKLNVDRTTQARVKRQMEKAQREYYLNEDQGDPQGARTQGRAR